MSAVQQSAQAPWIGLMIITGGAIMMLISMVLDWYTVRDPISSINLDFFDLVTERFSDLNYAGTGLPLFFIIVFSLIVLISVLYSSVSGNSFITLWIWLGLLCLASLTSNFLYILVVQMSHEDSGYYAIPHAGWILAFIGALAIFPGSGYADRTVSQSNPMV